MGEESGMAPEAKGRKRSRLVRVVVGLVLLVIVAAASITGAFWFDHYTEGDQFCGTLCHPMDPQITAYEVSDHTNVECGVCHIGPGLWPKVNAKINGTKELYMLVTDSFHRPIPKPVAQLRPADEICEQCHWPERDYGARVKAVSRFASDEANTETTTYIALRTGGGEGSESHDETGREAIHWHVANPVSYVALDDDLQEIPWVSVEAEDGSVTEFVADGSSHSVSELQGMEQVQMDCMGCHNRAAHKFRKPEDVLDEALAAGRIDSSLPYIKREANRFLALSAPTQAAGLKALEGFSDAYLAQFPNLTSAQKTAVDDAEHVLLELYDETTFPDMNVDWESYPSNAGHTNSAGCFRCHDGQHASSDGEIIASNCTTCHSVPVVVESADQTADGDTLFGFFSDAEQPASHSDALFIEDHRILAGASCVECHGPVEYGTDNESFCANSACHDQEWSRADLTVEFEHPVELEGLHAEATCNACHQGVREPSLEDCSTCHKPPSEPHFGPSCADCHTPEGFVRSAVSWLSDVPSTPHSIAGALQCTTCHDGGVATAAPADHSEIPEISCLECHKVAIPEGITAIPHLVEGRGGCLACHSEGDLQPVPTDHIGRPSNTCMLCHEQGDA